MCKEDDAMKYDVYCDESRQDLLVSPKSINQTAQYCCIGGLMVPTESRDGLKEKILKLKVKYCALGEIKWSTVSPSKLPLYLDLIDLFFDTPDLFFRTIVIDATKIRNNTFNENDHELGYYKFYYLLLYHWFVCDSKYRVFTDQKTNRDKKRLQELMRIVNVKFALNSPLESIQAIDSKESLILQMQNIIMGAVGYKYNFQGKGCSSAKKQIVERIESHLGHFIKSTSINAQKFNVFEICLREEH